MSVDDRALITLAHAEHQLATADVTGSSEEYRFWALTLCRCMPSDSSHETRLSDRVNRSREARQRRASPLPDTARRVLLSTAGPVADSRVCAAPMAIACRRTFPYADSPNSTRPNPERSTGWPRQQTGPASTIHSRDRREPVAPEAGRPTCATARSPIVERHRRQARAGVNIGAHSLNYTRA